MSDDVSLKEIGRDLWGNKPLLIAVLAGVGIVAYILIKNSNQAASVASAPTSASTLPTGSGATYVEESYNNYQNIVTTTNNPTPIVAPPVVAPPIIVMPHNPFPGPVPTPQPQGIYTARTRGKIAGNPYDKNASMLPWPGTGGSIPYNVPVTIPSGGPDPNGNYIISYGGNTGWMRKWDLIV